MLKFLLLIIVVWVGIKYYILRNVHLEHIGALKTVVERYENGEDYSEFENYSNQIPQHDHQ